MAQPAAPAQQLTLSECERILMEEEGGICETQYEQITWHTGKKLWHRTFKNCYRNMRDLWEDVVKKHGAREYMVYECPISKVETRLTYNEVAAQVNALANAMSKDYGVVKGDRVAIAARNYPEWIVGFWASICLGAIPAMVNAWLVTDELKYCIQLADAKVALIDPERHERLLPVISELKQGGVAEFILFRAGSDPKGAKPAYEGTVLWEDVMRKHQAGRGYLAPVDIQVRHAQTPGWTGLPRTYRNSQMITGPFCLLRELQDGLKLLLGATATLSATNGLRSWVLCVAQCAPDCLAPCFPRAQKIRRACSFL